MIMKLSKLLTIRNLLGLFIIYLFVNFFIDISFLYANNDINTTSVLVEELLNIEHDVEKYAVSLNGKLFAYIHYNEDEQVNRSELLIYDLDTGELIRKENIRSTYFYLSINNLFFTNDSKKLILDIDDGIIKIWQFNYDDTSRIIDFQSY